MKEESDFEVVNRLGLGPLYSRMEIKKRDMAEQYCLFLIQKVESWEKHLEHVEQCLHDNSFFGYNSLAQKLSETDKIVLFWKILAEEIKNHPKELYKSFPEKLHYYNEENLKTLYRIWDHRRWGVIDVTKPGGTDAESSIMGALRRGEGDSVGF